MKKRIAKQDKEFQQKAHSLFPRAEAEDWLFLDNDSLRR